MARKKKGKKQLSQDPVAQQEGGAVAQPSQIPEIVHPVQAPGSTPVSVPPGQTPVPTPSKETPVPTPSRETPVPTPSRETPVPTPSRETPVPTPSRETPVPTPSRETPVPTPSRETPVPTPSRETPVPMPSRETPVPMPSRETPVPMPSKQTAVLTPKESIGKGRGRGRGKGSQASITALQPGMRTQSAQPTSPERQENQPTISFGVDPQHQMAGIPPPHGIATPQPPQSAAFPQGVRQRPIHDQPMPQEGKVAPFTSKLSQQPKMVERVPPQTIYSQPEVASQQIPKSTSRQQQLSQPKKQDVPKGPIHAASPPKTVTTPRSAGPQKSKDSFEMKALSELLPNGGPLMPPKRKGYGTVGQPIRLRANHLAVRFDSRLVVHHYDVEIKPELKNMKGLKRCIIQTMISIYPKMFIKRCVFDGEKNLFTTVRLPFPNDVETFEVTLPSNNPNRKPRIFNVTVKIASYVYLSELQKFLDGLIDVPPQNAIQALDIVLRHMPTEKYISLGRSIFPQETGPDIGQGVQMWTGYYQSLRPQWKTLHLNLDVSHRTFFRSQPVMDYACELLNMRDYGDLLRMPRGDWEIVAKELRGLKIEVTHTHPVKRSYRIIGLSKQTAEFQTFPLEHDGKTQQCTVAKYFLDMYKKPLRYAKLPCLQAQPADKHRYLPIEFCMIPVGQQCKKLSDTQTAAMIKKTAKPAPEREWTIKELIKTTAFNLDEYAREFGLSVSDKLVDVPGRVIPPPGIQLQRNEVNPRRGVWDMRSQKFFRGVHIKVWGVFTYCRMAPQAVQNFAFQLMKIGEEVGSTFDPPTFSEIMRPDSNYINEHFVTAREMNPQLQLIICILPGKTPLYAEVKRVADTIVGIQTQCIQRKNVERTSPATLTNIMMKINAKMDGTNSVLGKMKSDIFKRPVIIFGADVTHPPAGDKSKPSIAAIVASMDMNAQVYRAKVLVQDHRVEIITDLKVKVRELLIEFHKTLKCKPEKIIFYRDGVGEGQFYEVLRHELIAIRAACSSLDLNYKPAITFLVVQKRHHTRLFCENERDADGKAKNVPPGTTVDRVITHPTENDFYLCSHQGIQGTSRPTHYHVLWDDTEFTADQLQLLTYQLCHTYVRCTRSVSIPAPAYYAHLVAFRARYHLEKLQRDLDRDGARPETYIERMQTAVEAHEKLGKMYYV